MQSNSNLSETPSRIRLTQTVKKGGCAAKVAAIELRKILSLVRFPAAAPELLVDGHLFDDAAVYRVSTEVAMVQTLDFFTPIVDDPFDFGRVAAANAISDVYAMGARPATALAILAFPLGELSNDVIAAVMNGACHVLSLAKCSLAGGHSIDDDTLKFGLSVTGLAKPDEIWTNAGARPGDALILTKPLGTGALSAALKRGEIGDAEMKPAIDSMATLNDAIEVLEPAGLHRAVRAATDVTGFGFAGHAMQMAVASGVRFAIRADRLPRLPLALELLAEGILTKAHRTNKDYVSSRLEGSEALSDPERLLLFDPQTSGGLLLAVDPEQADQALAAIRLRFPSAAFVGRAEAADPSSGPGAIRIAAEAE